ncbi:MAG TPA: PDR/VanB family oxidoreductase [Acidimicrobiales bacterium]|nr:PDR/VanB family oxidoreductase [Acidimicrobiales bacterium]
MDAVVSARRQIATRTVEIALERRDGRELGAWEPGSHVDLHLPGGLVRQYSLCGDPADTGRWTVAVLDVAGGRGGSRAVHERLVPGTAVTVDGPRNTFPLVAADRYVFVAGGIGITPIVTMVESAARGPAPWHLLYLARDRDAMAYADRLAPHGDAVTLWSDAERGICDVAAALADRGPGTTGGRAAVYCCGPEPLLGAVERLAGGWPPGTLHVERFSAVAEDTSGDSTIEVRLERSGLTLEVPAGCSILEAVERAGVAVLSSCREGTCGTCETDVLDGVPEHRDSVLDEEARGAGDIMMICVSRSRSPRLVLDI